MECNWTITDAAIVDGRAYLSIILTQEESYLFGSVVCTPRMKYATNNMLKYYTIRDEYLIVI